ncbi:MAG: cystathionine gamma-lyase [Thermoleophilaceae bacterium]
MTGRGPSTRAVHAGLPPGTEGEPFLPGPTFAAPFHLAGDPNRSPHVYGRYGNPTWTAYERALGELEGGEAVLFGSGMAAASAVLLTTVAPGDVLVVPSDAYMGLRGLVDSHLHPRGVEVRALPTAGGALERACLDGATLDGATLVWLESPTNPGLDVIDVAAVADAAHARGALVAVDDTLATPLLQRPLELGADYSVTSDTKAMTGHADLVLGHVAARDPARAQTLREWRTLAGAIAGPFEAWLAHRSLSTLALRLARQQENALALATALLGRPEVSDVRYPGLPDDPAHRLATRQMAGFGPVLTFALPDGARAERFLAELRIVAEATSFGGVHSTAERRGRWGGDEVPEGLIRFSAGCEDPEDLLADVLGALEAASG